MSTNISPELLIVMKGGATAEQTENVVARLSEAGVHARVSRGREATVIGAIGDQELLTSLPLEAYPGVEQVLPILKPYKLVSREISPDPTVIEARGRKVGDGWFGLIAGPCSVETREQTLEAARAVADAGATMLRGGAFKPRTSPYSFQGLGVEALSILREAREETGLPIVTELMDPRHVEEVLDVADVVQIGARNMQNFLLLAELGRIDRPVLLKRGLSSSVEELLMAAEYVAKEGNERIILCERGIKTFETATRFTLDLGAVAVLKTETHLPVIVDPSHAAGRRDLVLPLARAAAAVGADGIIVEVHPRPEEALSDGPQQIPAHEFADFARAVTEVVSLMGREIGDTRALLTELGLYKLFGEDPEKTQRFARSFMGHVATALAPSAAFGIDRVPESGGLVVASNHLNAIDPLLLPIFCPRTVYLMAKIELLDVPLAGEVLRWLGSFAVRRGEGDRDAIRVARWIVSEGHVVGFFSEGTRQILGYPGASHAGAAMIAIQEGVPLVPCGLDTFQWSLRNRRKCAMVWGEPIDLSGLPRNGKGYKEGAGVADEAIHRLWRQAAEAVVAGVPDQLPDGARRTGPLSGDDVSYIDATPWPNDEWARGPLGPVHPAG